MKNFNPSFSHIKLKLIWCTFIILAWTTTNLYSQIYINEFMASNDATIADENGEFDDWVELYNAGTTAVDIGGYFATDDLDEADKWQIPADAPASTTIPAGGFLILWFDGEPEQGPLHIDAKLSGSGEAIGLFNGSDAVDTYTYDAQQTDISEGRVPDGGATWDFYVSPTPGATNNTDPGLGEVEPPVASQAGGFYSSNVSVDLSTITPDAVIYYTTDGSEPTTDDMEYTGTLNFSSNTTLRARAFKNPLSPSPVMTESYLYNIDHSVAVIAYSGDPDELFDPAIGIYPNFEEDIEINVNAEFFEPDGSLGFNQYLESEIQGTGSASNPQKSLALKAKGSLGSPIIDYQVFPDLPFTEMRSLTLRNSGQDWAVTFFRDAMVTSLVRDLTDVGEMIKTPKLYTQGFRPGVVYINGEYWGLHNVRERMDKRYLKVHFDLDENEIDFLENANEIREGDLEAWESLTAFLENNSLASESNFEQVADQVDLDHYRDYIVFNLFVDNYDWPGNNDRRWRKRDEGEQWRWMTWDLDFSFGLFVGGQPWNSGYNQANSLDRLLNPNGFNWPNPDYATLLFRRLVENDNWRTEFVNRMADQLNVLYGEDRINNRIDEFVELYTPEFQQHNERWYSGFLPWQQNINILRGFADDRDDLVRSHFVDAFDDITGTAEVNVNSNNFDGGSVELSTVTIDEDHYPWSGIYFTGVDIPVQVHVNRGFYFTGWSGSLSGTEQSTSVNLSGPSDIIANFGPGSSASFPIVINEINYNSPDNPDSGDWVELYNPNSFEVNMSGWYFEDESGRFFGFPGNTIIPAGAYLVLVEDADDFSSIFPGVTNILGEFGKGPQGFGLSGGGELITLKNAVGSLIDAVEYDDNDPWPEAADGDGPSLQLINPSLDNALPESWTAIAPTPGASNDPSNTMNQIIDFPAIADQLTTNSPFNINATASSGLTVSFSILSGPASISGNTITLDGTPGQVSVQATQAGNADWNPAPPVVRTFTVSEITQPPGDYCDSKGEQPWQEWIEQVDFGDISNNSFKESYGDFTDQSTTVEQGQSYTITLQPGFSYFQWDEYFRVWIDFNGDGDFEDNGETIFSGIYSAGSPGSVADISGSINIPANASLGTTRMRVSMQRGAYADPCGVFELGEVEDYSINITSGSGNPLPEIKCPEDITITVSAGQTSAVVNFDNPEILNPGCGNLNITQDGGLPSGSAFPLGIAFVQFKAVDDCGEEVACSFVITVIEDNTPSGDYCESRGNEPWQEWIAGVVFEGIGNESFKDQYGDFTDQTAIVNIGQSYPIVINVDYSYFQYDEYVRVWIDYNQDGDFFDAGEMVYENVRGAAPPGNLFPLLGSVTIPENATLGTTRMRVSMQRDAYPGPCDIFTLGEVEDYSVLINGSTAGSNMEAPPEDFLMFRTDVYRGDIDINWWSNTGEKDDYFELQYAVDGEAFETITTYINDNFDNDLIRYYHQQQPLTSGRHYFRLRQVLRDGSIRYSEVQVVDIVLEAEIQLFPNPVRDIAHVYLRAHSGKAGSIQLCTALGQPLYYQAYDALPDTPIELSLREYQAGTYFVVIQIEGRKLRTLPLVKQD